MFISKVAIAEMMSDVAENVNFDIHTQIFFMCHRNTCVVARISILLNAPLQHFPYFRIIMIGIKLCSRAELMELRVQNRLVISSEISQLC